MFERILSVACTVLLVAFLIQKAWLLAIAFGLAGFMFLSLYDIRKDTLVLMQMSILLTSGLTGIPLPKEELEKMIGRK